MTIELSQQDRKDAVASLQRYFEANLPEPIGDLAAGILLDFFLTEIGPAIYNKAVLDAQTQLQQRVADLDGELHLDPFQYWVKSSAARRGGPAAGRR